MAALMCACVYSITHDCASILPRELLVSTIIILLGCIPTSPFIQLNDNVILAIFYINVPSFVLYTYMYIGAYNYIIRYIVMYIHLC